MIQAIGRLAAYRRRRESRHLLQGLPSRYQVESELGQGGMAVVYLARDRELDRQVAVKVLHPGLAFDRDAVVRLGNEARLVAQLQHPNIVAIHDIEALENGGVALVMQYVQGDTLKGVLDTTGKLPIERAERILREVASALSAAHRRGIIHRDVKPENIYIEQESGRAMLADFGIARAPRIDLGPTEEGEAIGTPHYMSPEQIAGRQVDGRSDVYSLALVGYEMLTGERPWNAESLDQVLHKQQHEYLPSLVQRRPDVPNSLDRALGKALRKDPILRPASAGDFFVLLQRRDRPRTSHYHPVADPAPPPRRPVTYETSPQAPTVRIDRSMAGRPPVAPTEPAAAPDPADRSAETADPTDRTPFLLRTLEPPPSAPMEARRPSSGGATYSSRPLSRAAADSAPTVAMPARAQLPSATRRGSPHDETFLASLFGVLAGAAGVAGVIVGVGILVMPRGAPSFGGGADAAAPGLEEAVAEPTDAPLLNDSLSPPADISETP